MTFFIINRGISISIYPVLVLKKVTLTCSNDKKINKK